MKKALFFSILTLNLIFSVGYKDLAHECLLSNFSADSCKTLVQLCDNDDGKACFYVGSIMFFGTTSNNRDERILAYDISTNIFKRACSLGYKDGCKRLKNVEESKNYIMRSGEFNVAQNLSEKQFNQLWTDCLGNENVSSCQRLANSGILPSVEQCDKEIRSYIGLVYDIAQNYQQAFKYYKKACELNDKFGCGNLANLYYDGRGIKQNFAEAFKLAKKACELNYMGACHNLGFWYDKGKGIQQDFVNAKKYYEKACNANVAEACNNLGALYVNGLGVKQNLSTAKKYFGKACNLGFQMGCGKYKLFNEYGIQ